LPCLGVCHPDLQTFLETNLPKSSKKEKILLGVSDSKLAAAVAEANGTACMHTGVVPEIVRGKFISKCNIKYLHREFKMHDIVLLLLVLLQSQQVNKTSSLLSFEKLSMSGIFT